MLSPKARAFSVDHLIGKSEKKAEIYTSIYPGGPRCFQKTDPSNYDRFVQTVYDDSGTMKIEVELGHGDLWESFHRLGTEMIITKSGRRMFPAVRVRLMKLIDDRKYRVYLDFLSVDKHKYRYVYHSSKWMVSGTGDCPLTGQKHVHPDCPVGGNYLINHVISFEKLKLTNNEDPKPGQISLVSMQKFIPRIHVDLLTSDLKVEAHFVSSFDQTAFMAVTAYQNQEITRLKIARNPFAKGFRESGKSRSTLEVMMSSFHSYMMYRNNHSPTKKRQHFSEELDLPRKILKPTPTRFDPHVNQSTPSPFKHGTACSCHFCITVSTYHNQPSCQPCFCSLSRDATSEITPCHFCPSSFLPYWSYPCAGMPRQSPVNCHPFYTTETGYTYGCDDVKPNVRSDVKTEPVSGKEEEC